MVGIPVLDGVSDRVGSGEFGSCCGGAGFGRGWGTLDWVAWDGVASVVTCKGCGSGVATGLVGANSTDCNVAFAGVMPAGGVATAAVAWGV